MNTANKINIYNYKRFIGLDRKVCCRTVERNSISHGGCLLSNDSLTHWLRDLSVASADEVYVAGRERTV